MNFSPSQHSSLTYCCHDGLLDHCFDLIGAKLRVISKLGWLGLGLSWLWGDWAITCLTSFVHQWLAPLAGLVSTSLRNGPIPGGVAVFGLTDSDNAMVDKLSESRSRCSASHLWGILSQNATHGSAGGAPAVMRLARYLGAGRVLTSALGAGARRALS